MIALDTNILLYAVQANPPDAVKAALAGALLLRTMEEGGIVPMQVLGEYLAVVSRKAPDQTAAAQRTLRNIADSCATPATTVGHLLEAQACAQRYRLQFFDSLILTVAAAAGADTLYSEDMQHGLAAGDIRVVNPFLETPRKSAI